MEDGVQDLPGHLAGLFAGTVNLVQFQRWIGVNSLAVELHGSDDDLELLNVIEIRLAEYTSGSIDAAQLLHALRTDPLVSSAFVASPSTGHGM